MVKQPHNLSPQPMRQDRGEPQALTSTELMRGKREVVIEHLGERYRLQQTRNGKLILDSCFQMLGSADAMSGPVSWDVSFRKHSRR